MRSHYVKVKAAISEGVKYLERSHCFLQSRQIESAKVSLPSLVSIHQLDSSNLSHDSTFLLNIIYYTAQTL